MFLLVVADRARAEDVFIAGRGERVVHLPVGLVPGPPAGPKGAKAGKGGLHIPRTRAVSFTRVMMDGGGYRWDIQSYGTVGNGTNNTYSGGMYCQVNGTRVRSTGQGWVNAAGDEIEIGPYSTHGVNAYRRVKVYKDRGLARWLDIFENNGASKVNINVRIHTCTSWMIATTVTSSGGASFGPKDWAFITKPTPGNRAPALLHVVGDKRSKLRPNVSIRNNQIYVNYSVTVPPKGTVILCHFEAQHPSVDALRKSLKKFKTHKLLADLSPAVRKLILNFSQTGGLLDIELERSESSDPVMLKHGDPVNGTVKNESFRVRTLFGELTLPAGKVVGMVASTGEDDSVRFVLIDGQVVNGIPMGEKLQVLLPTRSLLKIPLADIKQWSYRISAGRPEEIKFSGPMAVLRTGDQLAFDAAATKLRLRTRNGTIALEPGDLYQIVLDNPSNAVHRVHFINGSVLGGFLEPKDLALTLKLGKSLRIRRDMVSRLRFAVEPKPAEGLTHLVLSNGDDLYGRLATPVMTLLTDYGEAQVKPINVTSMRFSGTHLGRAVVELWNGTVLRGQLKDPVLAFQIRPGPELKIYANQVVALVRPAGLPPEHVLKKVAGLVALLGAESYKDRQRATEELSKMDPAIAPMLKKYLSSSDPEVRRRIEEILQKLGGGASATPAAADK